jgi:hypothetical protein
VVAAAGSALDADVLRTQVITIKVVGRHPDAVADDVEESLNAAAADGWRLRTLQPITYNSSTTGYLLLIVERTGAGKA